MKPKALVLAGYGLNCNYETNYALQLAGANSEEVHINELLRKEKSLEDYHILAFDGGFSWGDDHGAGVLEACKFKYNMSDELYKFIQDGKLIIGICNGFQALINMGLLPGFNGNYDSRQVALIANDCGNFRDDWVYLRVNVNSPCVFSRGIKKLELHIRHDEGKFYAPQKVIQRLLEKDQVVLQYAKPNWDLAEGEFPWNPNGSIRDIAGICDSTGRVFGLMPHPEGFIHFTNHPNWTRKKREVKAIGKPIPEEGSGLAIFKNAVKYISDQF